MDAPRDNNFVPATLFEIDGDPGQVMPGQIDQATGRILVDASGGGSGTVTSVSVATANGFAGTVANATTTPAITISTTINSPVLAGNGTAISAATTTGSGSTVVLATAPTFPTSLTVGTAAGSTGTILFKGTTSGTVTLSVADAAGTWTMKLPTSAGTNGYFLKTDGSGNTSWDTGPAASLTVGSTSIASGTTTRILYDNAGVLGEYTITGSGTVVAMATNPTLSGLTMADATNIVLDTTTGTKIGTATTQKLGFYNATPIVQPTGDTVTALQNLGLGASLTVAADTVKTANEATDTTCFPLFVTASGTQTLQPKNNTSLTFNSSTASLGATLITATTSVTSASILASSNDSGALGASGTAFADLFLASGGVINWNAGNATLTHSAGLLTSNVSLSLGTSNALTTGTIELGAASDTTLARAGAGSVSIEGVIIATESNSLTLSNKTISGALTLAENASIALDPAGSADGKWTGISITATAGYTQAFGDLVYLDPTDSRWEAADANSASGADGDARGILGMVVSPGTDGNACTILLQGVIRADAKFPTFTVNNPIYVSETAGSVTQTQPTTTDVVIRIVGSALTADEMYFNPDNTWITHT